MNSKDKIKKETADCMNAVKPIVEFLQEKSKNKNYSFHLEYQKWYSIAIKIIEFLAPDRYAEFKSYYEIDPRRKSLTYGTYVIQDYIKGVVPAGYQYENFDSDQQTITNVYNQYTILHSVYERIDSILADIQTYLYTEVQDLELESARSLLRVNVRSSGVIAGVILEGYLHKIVDKHEIKISKKNPTLSEFNELLKANNIYDTTVWRKISYLGDIRNTCAHKKEKDPTKEQVEELIEGVNWVTKNIF